MLPLWEPQSCRNYKVLYEIEFNIIEHSWEGYYTSQGIFIHIIFLYVIIPRIKSKVWVLPFVHLGGMNPQKDAFYRFVLDYRRVLKDLDTAFTFTEKKPFGGIKGFKNEIKLLKLKYMMEKFIKKLEPI
jgi:hypothetical protein